MIAADEDLGPVPPWRGTGTRPRRPAGIRHLRVKATAARRWAAERPAYFRRVTWRMSRPAIVVSLLVTTLPMLGDYFTVDLLSGSPETSMVGNLINNSVLTPGQTGQAGAFVLLILVVSVVPMVLYLRSTRSGAEVKS